MRNKKNLQIEEVLAILNLTPLKIIKKRVYQHRVFLHEAEVYFRFWLRPFPPY